jgi:hypothetical protein
MLMKKIKTISSSNTEQTNSPIHKQMLFLGISLVQSMPLVSLVKNKHLRKPSPLIFLNRIILNFFKKKEHKVLSSKDFQRNLFSPTLLFCFLGKKTLRTYLARSQVSSVQEDQNR